MYLSKIIVAIGTFALFASTNAGVILAPRDDGVIQARALTAIQVQATLVVITTKSRDLKGTATSINLAAFLQAGLGQGPVPKLVIGLLEIVKTITVSVTALTVTEPFTELSDQRFIFLALVEFVRIHQELLSIIIGKGGLLPSLIVGVPIAAALRQIEGVVDTFALILIRLLAEIADEVEEQTDALSSTCQDAIDAYTL